MATGKTEQGTVKVGEKVEIVGLGDVLETVVMAIGTFKKLFELGTAGEVCERTRPLADLANVRPPEARRFCHTTVVTGK